VSEFLHWLGIDPKGRHISGKTMMGLLPNNTKIEIVHKFGSLQKFEHYKNKLTY